MSSVASILEAYGRTQAELARSRGAIWGEAIQNLSQIPGQILQQQRQQQRLDAQTALEQAREARLRGQEDRAIALEQHAQQDLSDKRQIATAAWGSGRFDPQAALAAAQRLNRTDLYVDIQEQAEKHKPKLEQVRTRTPEGGETVEFVEPAAGLTRTSAPVPTKLTYGQPFDAVVNGKHVLLRTRSDGQTVDLRGNAVETGVGAYEKPEHIAPEPLVPIIGADGKPVLVRRSQAEGKTPASSREQGRPVTSGDAGRIAEIDSSLDDVQRLGVALSAAGETGTVAKIGASAPNWVTDLTGWGVDAKKKQALIDRVKQVIGKALEGGVLRKEDEIKYEKILPTIGDTTEVVKAKLAGLDTAVRGKRDRTLEALGDAGYEVSRFQRTERGAVVPPDTAAGADPLGLFGSKKP